MPRHALGGGKLECVERIPGRPTYRIDFRDEDGKRHRKQLSTDLEVAKQASRELIRDRDLALNGLAVPSRRDPTLAELSVAYLADLKMHVSPKHAENKGGRLARALKLVDAVRVSDVTPLKAAKLQNDLAGRGLSNTTANMHTTAIGGMLNWAVTMRMIDENPIKHVRPLPITERHLKYRRRALSEVEIERFLKAASEDDRCQMEARVRDVPQALFWRTLIETGMRYGEAGTLTWADVDFAQGAIHLRAENTKSSKDRTIPVGAGLLADLTSLQDLHCRLRARPITLQERVFLSPGGTPMKYASNNANKVLRRVLALAGIARTDETGRKVDLHALRGTFATRLARNGIALTVTQKLLGHADPKLTAKAYTKLEVADARMAIQSLAPAPTSDNAQRLRRA